MPDIGPLHPQVVHFVVALGIIGVLFRIVSLSGRLTWTSPAAFVLIIIAAGASVVAAESGHQAHEWAEQIPGVRPAVQEHEELGEMTRNIFLLVGALELAGLALYSRPSVRRVVHAVSAIAGIAACIYLYEAGEHGGELVYNWAGGIGTRSGNPEDVRNLLVAGLYHESGVARKAGRFDEAARLMEEMARQRPDDPSIKVMAIDAGLQASHDTAGTMAQLDSMVIVDTLWRAGVARGLLQAQILAAMGKTDSARASLTALAARFPQSRRPKMALEKLK